jgi:hypothetical protein
MGACGANRLNFARAIRTGYAGIIVKNISVPGNHYTDASRAVLVIPTNALASLFFWRPEHPILSPLLPSAWMAVIPSGEILTRL